MTVPNITPNLFISLIVNSQPRFLGFLTLTEDACKLKYIFFIPDRPLPYWEGGLEWMG